MTDNFVAGGVIRSLREGLGLTQGELAERINVTDKAVSKWETGRGFPDIGLVEPLAAALGISVAELLAGGRVRNANVAANMERSLVRVCPACGNVVVSSGEAVVSCCGVRLQPLEAAPADGEHRARVEAVEDELFVSLGHPMEKGHFISFMLALSGGGIQLAKLYPEQEACARFKVGGVRRLFAFCSRHGLFEIPAGASAT